MSQGAVKDLRKQHEAPEPEDAVKQQERADNCSSSSTDGQPRERQAEANEQKGHHQTNQEILRMDTGGGTRGQHSLLCCDVKAGRPQ